MGLSWASAAHGAGPLDQGGTAESGCGHEIRCARAPWNAAREAENGVELLPVSRCRVRLSWSKGHCAGLTSSLALVPPPCDRTFASRGPKAPTQPDPATPWPSTRHSSAPSTPPESDTS